MAYNIKVYWILRQQYEILNAGLDILFPRLTGIFSGDLYQMPAVLG